MIICWIFVSENIFEEAVVVELDLTIFAPLLALLLAVASFCLPKYLLEHQIVTALKGHGSAKSSLGAIGEGESSKLSHLSPTEQLLASLLQRRFLFFVFRLALIEQIAIVGLLLALWQGSFSIIIPYAFFSAVLLAYAHPQLNLWLAEDRKKLLTSNLAN